MNDRHAPVVLARIWRVHLVVMIGCLEGTATPALCRPAKTHVASERKPSKAVVPFVILTGVLPWGSSAARVEPIQLGGTVGTTGYCAQDAEPYV
jgi:hypothetical protein